MLRRLTLVVLLVVSLPAIGTASVPGSNPDRSSAAERAVDAVASDATERTGSDALSVDGSDTDTSTAEAEIVRSIELRLTPADPGTFEAVVSYDLPEAVTTVEVSLGAESTVTSMDGFEREGTGTYAWTASTNQPTLRLRVDANQTSGGRRVDRDTLAADRTGSTTELGSSPGELEAPTAGSGTSTVDDGFVFVDAGSWALVRVPRVGTRWRWSGTDDVGLRKETTVDGPGATGGEMAYMGDVTRYEASARDERIRLVVPERASLNDSAETVLESLTAASERLRVGERSETVVVIAAPDGVEWGVAGLQYGDDDAWVLADEPVSSPDNVWIHEYVHTRQSFDPTESGTWTVEATAEYYAGLLTFEQGRVTHDAFRENLAKGLRDRYDDDVLAAPSTWSGGANYLKGSLAAGGIDLRLRRTTNQTVNFQRVFRDLNAYDGSVSNDVFLDAVEDAGGSDVRSDAAALTRTRRTAGTWSEATHAAYFGTLPAVFAYRIDGDVTATGALGDRELAGDSDSITVASGETLNVDVTVENVGWEAGTYSTAFTVDGTVVASRSGELDANASTTEPFTRTFERTGTYAVTVGDRTLEVAVVEPETPVVESIVAPSTAVPGANLTFTVTYRNDGRVPAQVTVPFSVDGEVVRNRTVLVPAESSVERTYSVSFETLGEHAIGVGERTVTVDVDGERTDDASAGDDVMTPVPGFGVPVALLAVAVLAVFEATRRRP